jgi:hypothetical protein
VPVPPPGVVSGSSTIPEGTGIFMEKETHAAKKLLEPRWLRKYWYIVDAQIDIGVFDMTRFDETFIPSV